MDSGNFDAEFIEKMLKLLMETCERQMDLCKLINPTDSRVQRMQNILKFAEGDAYAMALKPAMDLMGQFKLKEAKEEYEKIDRIWKVSELKENVIKAHAWNLLYEIENNSKK